MKQVQLFLITIVACMFLGQIQEKPGYNELWPRTVTVLVELVCSWLMCSTAMACLLARSNKQEQTSQAPLLQAVRGVVRA